MKCPKCGTTNGRTNRFCRGCGLRLENLATREPEKQVEAPGPPDELALGEELFEVWQVYSRGELDDALAKVQKILVTTPDSASAHSILALIYERQAETRLEAGEHEEARELMRLAIAEYERIIDLNPDSAADREKLASLRMRLLGPETGEAPAQPTGFRAAARAVPAPLWAAFATFLVVLMTAIILYHPGRQEKITPARPDRPTKLDQVSTPSAQSEAAASPGGLRVYTFPGPAESGYPMTPPSTSPPPVPEPERLKIPTEPAKLPSIVGANVKIVPEPKSEAKTPPKPPEPEEKPSNRPDGDDALARAAEFRRQGHSQDAVAAAQEAARLYQADIDAGHNVADARRGLDNARKIIQLSQEAAAASTEAR